MEYLPLIEYINNATGEINNLKEITNDINEVSINELAERLILIKETLKEVKIINDVIESKFIYEMNKNEATRHDLDYCEIHVVPRAEYEYDVECIEKLKCLIKEEDFNNIFKKEYKVNRNRLRKLYSLGGEIKTLSEGMQKKILKKSNIKLKLIK